MTAWLFSDEPVIAFYDYGTLVGIVWVLDLAQGTVTVILRMLIPEEDQADDRKYYALHS